MIFAGIKLPRKLARHVGNLSATIQVLLTELVLAVEGQEDRARSEAGKLDYAMRNKRATEKLERELQAYLAATKLPTEDAAIGLAASVGRSTGEIAEFFEIEQMYAMRRLCAIRKRAASFKPRRSRVRQMVQLCFAFLAEPEEAAAEVFEVFADAARRRV